LSRRQFVLVDNTAKTIAAQKTNTACGRRRGRPSWLRWRQRQFSMWPVPVVMAGEHFKNPFEVLVVQRQQPVETFRADGAHEPLGDSVGLGRAKRRTNDLKSLDF